MLAVATFRGVSILLSGKEEREGTVEEEKED